MLVFLAYYFVYIISFSIPIISLVLIFMIDDFD